MTDTKSSPLELAAAKMAVAISNIRMSQHPDQIEDNIQERLADMKAVAAPFIELMDSLAGDIDANDYRVQSEDIIHDLKSNVEGAIEYIEIECESLEAE